MAIENLADGGLRESLANATRLTELNLKCIGHLIGLKQISDGESLPAFEDKKINLNGNKLHDRRFASYVR